jgi:hypothetical protein
MVAEIVEYGVHLQSKEPPPPLALPLRARLVSEGVLIGNSLSLQQGALRCSGCIAFYLPRVPPK